MQNYVSLVNTISNERIVGIELRYNNQLPLYIFCVYMPSDSDVILYNDTLCDIQSVFSHYCKIGTVIFAGDFNAQLDTDSRRTPLHQIFHSNAYTYVTARSRIDHIFIERSASQMCTKYSVADPHDVLSPITCQYSLLSITGLRKLM